MAMDWDRIFVEHGEFEYVFDGGNSATIPSLTMACSAHWIRLASIFSTPSKLTRKALKS